MRRQYRDLYTSLLAMKRAINGGELPPMTPLSERALGVCDPAFTIGMGALVEDAEKGLRCPVRGCGQWRHILGPHLDREHAEYGGREGVTRTLGIPTTASLCSSEFRQMRKSVAAIQRDSLIVRLAEAREKRRPGDRDAKKQGRTIGETARSIGARNLVNHCEAQMRHAMIDLQNKLGRSPSRNDARAELGDGFTSAAERLYGSWNAAKLAFDIVGYRPGGEARAHSREAVLASMQAFYEVHNRLPSAKEAQRRDRLPVTPSYPSVLRAMGAETWRDAMERVASFLDIHGGKYGLPVKAVAAA